MAVCLPTLTISGFVFDKNIIMKKLFEYFITSDYSQSTLYYGKITSLKYCISENRGDTTAIAGSIRFNLQVMYSRYFENVEVMVTPRTDYTEAGKNIINFYIDIDATDEDGNEYSLSRINLTVDLDNLDNITFEMDS